MHPISSGHMHIKFKSRVIERKK